MLETNEMKKIELEAQLINIMSNYTDVIDLIPFDEEFFSGELHKKIYRYLQNEKCMNYSLMLDYMTHEEATEFIMFLYKESWYPKPDINEMAKGFAKEILELYKKEKIEQLNMHKNTMPTDTYFSKLTDIVKLSCEPVEENLTANMIDDVLLDEEQTIKISCFPFLSYYLKIGVTDLITIAGTSGFGKSAFLLNIYQSLSQSKGFKCHYFNLEVAPKMMIKRLLAITSNHKVDEFNKENIDKDFYLDARNKIINDSYIASGSTNIEDLKAKVLNSLDQDKINVVFVDHIGLLETTNKSYNQKEYDRVTYCMKELRNLALDNDLIIFVASQFDRASIKSGSIGMSSLKSSGEIENSSTHVLLLKSSKDRETPEEEKSKFQNIEIEIAKNRNGETRTLDNYVFQKTKQIFVES